MTLKFNEFKYTGGAAVWAVPPLVTNVRFECWGAAGGMSHGNAVEGAVNVTVGGYAPTNNAFTNHPAQTSYLGSSYSNGAGYAAANFAVTPGERFYIHVGGNGGPGYAAIRQAKNGSDTSNAPGGTAGYNGGAPGGRGSLAVQNLYDGTVTKVKFHQPGIPNNANKNDLWLKGDGALPIVYRCNANYTGGGNMNKWDQVTKNITPVCGSGGGGGGGATDVRVTSDVFGSRVLVAGGSGGSGGLRYLTGAGAWVLAQASTAPSPPLGADSSATPPRGADKTWATQTSFFNSGWGIGGYGGAGGAGSILLNGGHGTVGQGGGTGTDRHADTAAPTARANGGGGASGLIGGAGRDGGVTGTAGQGGTGASAPTDKSDGYCAGGGGGGGGYFGGGGGGYGFYVRSGGGTQGGGGGGGGNYAHQSGTSVVFAGAVRPPASAVAATPTGTSGLGGFARVSYRLTPTVLWNGFLNVAAVNSSDDFTTTFEFIRGGGDTGAAMKTYAYAVTVTNVAPALADMTVVAASANSDGATISFPAGTVPTNAVRYIWVTATDTDGDIAPPISWMMTGFVPAQIDPVTITSPTAGEVLSRGNDIEVTWDNGSVTPIVGLALQESIVDSNGAGGNSAGGTGTYVATVNSRVNLARDPGFTGGSAEWVPSDQAEMNGVTWFAADTTHPGVSGKNGIVDWTAAADNVAPDGTFSLTTTHGFNTAVNAFSDYRAMISIASSVANDTRVAYAEVVGTAGEILTSTTVDFSALAAGTYVPVELFFFPREQNVTFRIVPTDSLGTYGQVDGAMIHYLSDFLVEFNTENTSDAYFDGTNANGNPGTVSWSGGVNGSPSILTGTADDPTTFTIPATADPNATGATIQVAAISAAQVIAGHVDFSNAATVTVVLNDVTPTEPLVTMTVSRVNATVTLSVDPNDATVASKTAYIDIYRSAPMTNLPGDSDPDGYVHIARCYRAVDGLFHCTDTPVPGDTVSYRVRAWSGAGGWVETDDGTVIFT